MSLHGWDCAIPALYLLLWPNSNANIEALTSWNRHLKLLKLDQLTRKKRQWDQHGHLMVKMLSLMYLHCPCKQAYFNYTTTLFLLQYKHGLYSSHDSHSNYFLYLFILCTHACSFPILFSCVNGRRASWFISWVVIHENRRTFLCIPCWDEHQGWEEETGMYTDVSDSLSDHTGSSVFTQSGRRSWHRLKFWTG